MRCEVSLVRGSTYRDDETPHFSEFDRADGEPQVTDGIVFVPGEGENEMGARLKADAIWTQYTGRRLITICAQTDIADSPLASVSHSIIHLY